MSSFWSDKKVLVTGATGFIGSHLVETLAEKKAVIRAVGRNCASLKKLPTLAGASLEIVEGDLKSAGFADKVCKDVDVVINLAAEVAGVGFNSTHPATMFMNNLAVALPVLDAAVRAKVERFLCVSSACVYARFASVPTKEEEGFLDDPDPSNFGYGWAKRVLEIQARCYAQEFPIKIGIARPYNSYGPRDNFAVETSHVIPALIRRLVEGEDPMVVWGDGSQSRSFIYVTDFVDGLLAVAEHSTDCDPINIGSDEEITIRDLVHLLAEMTQSKSKIVFDTSRPTGQPRRNGDFVKAFEKTKFKAKTPLKEGLKRTVEWYLKNRSR